MKYMFTGNSSICRINTFGHRRKNIFYDVKNNSLLHSIWATNPTTTVLCAMQEKIEREKIMLLVF